MKVIILYPILYMVFAQVLSFSSCSNDPSGDPVQNLVSHHVSTGTWRVTSFIDSGKDETNHFSSYVFTFTDGGTVVAGNGNVSYTGNWSINDNNSNDDSPDDLDFTILFDLSNDFEELNEDWHFISHSPIRMELIHVSGGNGGTDYLTLEKI